MSFWGNGSQSLSSGPCSGGLSGALLDVAQMGDRFDERSEVGHQGHGLRGLVT